MHSLRLRSLLVIAVMTAACSESGPSGTEAESATLAAQVSVQASAPQVRSVSPAVDVTIPIRIENGSAETLVFTGQCGTVLERASVDSWRNVHVPVCSLEGTATIQIPPGGQHAFDYVVKATPGAGTTVLWTQPVQGMYRLKIALQRTRDAAPIGIGFTQNFEIAPK